MNIEGIEGIEMKVNVFSAEIHGHKIDCRKNSCRTHTFKCPKKNSIAKYTYEYSSKYTYTTNTSIDMGINVRGISRSVSCLYVRLTLYAPPIQLGFYLLTSSKIHWFSSLRLMWRMCVLVQMMMPVLCCAVSVASYLVYYNAEHFIPFGFNSSTRFIYKILYV